MTTTRELPRTWTEGGVVYHEAFGKRTTVWVDCTSCGKRQPAGTEMAAWYSLPEKKEKIIRLSSTWIRPQIGRCAVCGARGPLLEIMIPTGSVSRTRCDRRCLGARGDECNCCCEGRCHQAGVCSCEKETA